MHLSNALRLTLHTAVAGFLLLSQGALADESDAAKGKPSSSRFLHVIRPDGTGLNQLPGKPNQTYGSPDWSPDGKWLAYDTWTTGQGFQDSRIEIMQVDGSQVRTI